MNVLSIELRKEKRTGVIPVLLAVGVLGAAYAFVNFLVRKDTLLNLPLAPMDVLLTQLYGVIMILNLFGIVVTNLIHASVDPKTVQYLAGHESSKITMDIYAKVKYNRPDDLVKTMRSAFASWDAAHV